MQQAHLIISGRVQGVFYRASCKEIAQSLSLTGWVRNLPTSQVEVLVQGEKEQIEKLINWCKKGPPSAKVSSVDIQWGEVKENFKGFSIL